MVSLHYLKQVNLTKSERKGVMVAIIGSGSAGLRRAFNSAKKDIQLLFLKKMIK